MLFVKIEDGTDNVELLVFETLKTTQEIWQEGKAVLQGRISDKTRI